MWLKQTACFRFLRRRSRWEDRWGGPWSHLDGFMCLCVYILHTEEALGVTEHGCGQLKSISEESVRPPNLEKCSLGQQSLKWGILKWKVPYKFFKGMVLRELISKSSTFIFTFFRKLICGWDVMQVLSSYLSLDHDPSPLVPKSTFLLIGPESHAGVLLWAALISCQTRRQSKILLWMLRKGELLRRNLVMNPLQDKWFPMHFLQQNIKRNPTRLTLDYYFWFW